MKPYVEVDYSTKIDRIQRQHLIWLCHVYDEAVCSGYFNSNLYSVCTLAWQPSNCPTFRVENLRLAGERWRNDCLGIVLRFAKVMGKFEWLWMLLTRVG
jgi:hypothetical protein